MIKIIGKSVLDLISFQQGVLFVIKEPSTDGLPKISYYSFDAKTHSIATVTKSAYLLTKFGQGFNNITTAIDDCISCEAQRISDGRIMITYTNGEIGIFSDNGELLHSDVLKYNDCPVRGLAYDGEHSWFAVPSENAIVRYNSEKCRIDMRIGGKGSKTFNNPCSVSVYDTSLFVSCMNSKSVIEMSLHDFTIINTHVFDEPIAEYIKTAGGEFAVLQSGIYLL